MFRVEKDYASLVELAVEVCEPEGWMLCCTNHRGLESWRFEAMVRAGLPEGVEIEEAPMPPEFTGEPYLKSLWVTV